MVRFCSILLFGTWASLTQPVWGAGLGKRGKAAKEEDVDYPLDAVLGPIMQDPALRRTTVSVQVVNVHSGEEVFARRADVALNPASVMKVLTSAVALRELGPGHRFSTYLASDARIDAEGLLQGDLYVQGFGDPTLVTENIWRLVYDLYLAGVRKIAGDVLYDDTHFDQKRLIAGWRKKVDMDNGPAYFAPLGALSVNFNTVCIVVSPGAEKGAPARVVVETPVGVVELENEVVTGAHGSRSRLKIERTVKVRKGIVKFTVDGSVPPGIKPMRFYRSVHDPLAYFIDVFTSVLEERGIEVLGEHEEGRANEGISILARIESDPLPAILGRMNKHSSNFVAEHVLKAVGAEVHEEPGTTAKGLKVITEYLEELGANRDEFALVNGSGLSRSLTLRASHINSVLIDMYHDRKVGPEFISSLAIGGVDGTLWTRFRGEGIAGRIRAKTGSLNYVNCLAGYVDSGDGEVYALTFLVNDIPGANRPIRRVHNRFGRALLDLPKGERGTE